jgi:transcription elongation factor Elf1
VGEVREQTIQCPYCGENIVVLVDDSVPQQNYIEDCQVCCRPIEFSVAVQQDGHVNILVASENE